MFNNAILYTFVSSRLDSGNKNGDPLDLLCVSKQVAEKVDVLAECSPSGNAFRSLTQDSDNTTLVVFFLTKASDGVISSTTLVA